MSWSLEVTDLDGRDLLKEFGFEPDLSCLGEESYNGDLHYSAHRLRDLMDGAVSAGRDGKPASYAFALLQACVKANLGYFVPHHCATCSCPTAEGAEALADRCERFLNIPLDRVDRIVVTR